MDVLNPVGDLLRGKDFLAHRFHRVKRLLRLVDAFPRVSQTDDEVIRSGRTAVRLEDVLQPLLRANVLLRCDAEVGDGDGSCQVKARQQPANGDGEESQNAEEDEQAARAARHADDQHGAEEKQECQKSQRNGPSQQLVEFVFVDERLEQVIRLGRLDEVESRLDAADRVSRVLRDQIRRVHHYCETRCIGHWHVPQVVDLQRQRFVLQRLAHVAGLRSGSEGLKSGHERSKHSTHLIPHIDEQTIQLLACIEDLN